MNVQISETQVLIGGVEYVPREATYATKEVMDLLCELYGALWIEAYYDPDNDCTRAWAKKHVGKIERLNEILHFKK